MPRRMQNAEPELTERQLFAVGEVTERIRHTRRLVQTQLRPVLRGKLPRAGDVVRMDVRVDDVAKGEPALAKERLVLLRLDRWVDDGGLVRLARRDEIGRTAAAFVEDLFEVHPGLASLRDDTD